MFGSKTPPVESDPREPGYDARARLLEPAVAPKRRALPLTSVTETLTARNVIVLSYAPGCETCPQRPVACRASDAVKASHRIHREMETNRTEGILSRSCLLYTSDAADE